MKKLIYALLFSVMLLTACKGEANPQISAPPTVDQIIDDHVEAAIGKVVDLGKITAAKVNDKICIFLEDELISYGQFDKLHLVEAGDENYLFGEMPGDERGKQLYSIAENYGISTDHFIHFNDVYFTSDYIITDQHLYDINKTHIFAFFTRISDSPEITATETGVEIVGKDAAGRDVKYVYDRKSRLAEDYNLSVNGDEITFTRTSVIFSPFDGNMTMTMDVRPGDLTSFGEYRVFTHYDSPNYFIKDGKVEKEFPGGLRFLGDWFCVNDGASGLPVSKIYDKNLEPITEKNLVMFTQMSDGRYIALDAVRDLEGRRECLVFDADGKVVFKGHNGVKIYFVGNDYIFGEEDGIIRLFTPDFEKLCDFGKASEFYHFNEYLSGAYNKDGQMGYYFTFTDTSRVNENGIYGSFEYYYVPKTGESGLIEKGFEDFAMAKPVLYLYPTKKAEISVKFENPERLTTVYPAYNGGWNVTASPSGILTDEKGRSYYALYWEEDSGKSDYRYPDGFCVPSEDSAEFLEEKLAELGFTELEANEFIMYWLPIMERNEYNLVRFELTEEREDENALLITPKPDSLLRVAMHIKGVPSPVHIKEQILPSFERVGFAAVEWGGCIH